MMRETGAKREKGATKKYLERRRKKQKRQEEGRVDDGEIGDEEKGCERTRERERGGG